MTNPVNKKLTTANGQPEWIELCREFACGAAMSGCATATVSAISAAASIGMNNINALIVSQNSFYTGIGIAGAAGCMGLATFAAANKEIRHPLAVGLGNALAPAAVILVGALALPPAPNASASNAVFTITTEDCNADKIRKKVEEIRSQGFTANCSSMRSAPYFGREIPGIREAIYRVPKQCDRTPAPRPLL